MGGVWGFVWGMQRHVALISIKETEEQKWLNFCVPSRRILSALHWVSNCFLPCLLQATKTTTAQTKLETCCPSTISLWGNGSTVYLVVRLINLEGQLLVSCPWLHSSHHLLPCYLESTPFSPFPLPQFRPKLPSSVSRAPAEALTGLLLLIFPFSIRGVFKIYHLLRGGPSILLE